MSFAKLDDLGRKLEALEHAQSMLSVDEAVQMPSGGGDKRAEAMAMLAGLYHELAAAPEIADWIGDARKGDLDATHKTALAEFERSYVNLTCLSSDFVRRQVSARVRSEQLWRELRTQGNWKDFFPAFEGIVALAREEAQLRAQALKLPPYDALIEQYDPGSRVADIAPVFAELKTFLKDFIPKALAAQAERRARNPARPFNAPFPIEKQKALGEAMMKAVGFDFIHGRLDVSHHPFCGGVPTDVRMTTRYSTSEFLSSLMGILHETGHGLYEQGLPKDWAHWPVGKARGMAAHESQSLFVEMQVARNPAFWEWAMPKVREHLGEAAIDGWSLEDILAHVHRIERGLIRVNADEATYPLHVILRFEIEQQLIGGNLGAKDVPEIWDAKMREYLGLSTIGNPKDGPMQDVHWPSGAFGYFPSYTLGAMMAAQQWAAVERTHPTVADDLRHGRFDTINDWRRKNIWSKASTLSTPELMRQATGETLQARYFTGHLRRRYLN
ncbi:MAG: carboxypeptidase M32 [Aestuariivirga sp.]